MTNKRPVKSSPASLCGLCSTRGQTTLSSLCVSSFSLWTSASSASPPSLFVPPFVCIHPHQGNCLHHVTSGLMVLLFCALLCVLVMTVCPLFLSAHPLFTSCVSLHPGVFLHHPPFNVKPTFFSLVSFLSSHFATASFSSTQYAQNASLHFFPPGLTFLFDL